MSLFWIALNAVKGLGPVRIKHLLARYDTPKAIFKESPSLLLKTGLLPEASIKQIHDPKLLAQAEEQLKQTEKHSIRVLTLEDNDYPQILREIFAPPPVIFAKGNTDIFSKHSIAVVGTRKASIYGSNVATHIVQKLTEHNISIISGLALGIDSTAHKTCLEYGGTTVAVLGNGIDKTYPASNKKLAEQIIDHGALVSEFPLGTRPESFNFPRRNRIISGLSAGVLVVEAGKKSGSLITAHYAMQQGREVFAVPGSIFSDKSHGTFNLIKNGATPVRSAQDILDNIETVKLPCVKQEIISKVIQIPQELLNKDERLIVDILSDEPQRMDQISLKSGKDISKLFTILLNLELKGLVKQISGQQYIKI